MDIYKLMITLNSTGPKSFLIYKTHLPTLDLDHTIILKNTFSDLEQELVFGIAESLNSYRIEVSKTDLTDIQGQNTLYVKNAEGAIIYREEARVK